MMEMRMMEMEMENDDIWMNGWKEGRTPEYHDHSHCLSMLLLYLTPINDHGLHPYSTHHSSSIYAPNKHSKSLILLTHPCL